MDAAAKREQQPETERKAATPQAAEKTAPQKATIKKETNGPAPKAGAQKDYRQPQPKEKITMGTIIFNDPEREYQKMKLRQEKGIRLDNLNAAERLAVDKELDDEITRRENFKAQREALKGGA